MLICQGILRSQLRSNSVVRLNEKQYLYLRIITKSQLLCSDYSHYNSYQEFLYNLCTSLKKKGLGYRKISYYLNQNGYKSVRGKEIKNTSVYSILKKGKMRIDRINKLKSHKDYGFTYDMELISNI
jgi:hypothetical protein